jgi:hypothetical protein
MTTTYSKGDSATRWASEFVLNTDLPEFPDKLNYYATVTPEITVEWVQAIGDKLGIIDEAGVSGDRIIMSQGDKWLEVDTAKEGLLYGEYTFRTRRIPAPVHRRMRR